MAIALHPDGRLLVTGEVGNNFAVAAYVNELNADVPGSNTTTPAIVIAPNPATTQTYVHGPWTSGAVTITLFDNTGRVVQQHAFTGAGYPLDLSQLPAGIYVLRSSAEQGEHSARLVVE
jgi:hypothetical protein